MKNLLGAAGIIAAAVLASSCCWLPLLLVGVGAAGLGAGVTGFTANMAAYRPYLAALVLALLAVSWYTALRRRFHPAGGDSETGAAADARSLGEDCCAPIGTRRSLLMLSFVTAAALAALLVPEIAGALAGRSVERSAGVLYRSTPVAVSVLTIKEMSCRACAVAITRTLLDVPGVTSARVDYQRGSARVSYIRGKVSVEQLQKVLAARGYGAVIAPPTE